MDAQFATKRQIALIREASTELLHRSGATTPPVDLELLARLQGVREIIREPLDGADAELAPTEGGYVIRVDESANHARQRFSIAHELGHTFFRHKRKSFRGAAVALDPRRTSRLGYVREERLCNIAAEELLMPREWFFGALRGSSPSLDEIEGLAELFDASVLATARRYASLCGHSVQINRWTTDGQTAEPWPDMGDALHPVKAFRVSEPQIEIEAVVAAACQSGVIQRGSDRVSNVPYQFVIEAKGFGRGQHRYALSLVISSAHP